MHLQGCLACKRCSASGLNCRYLNPYIKLKLIGQPRSQGLFPGLGAGQGKRPGNEVAYRTGYQTIPKILEKLNCRIFHDS